MIWRWIRTFNAVALAGYTILVYGRHDLPTLFVVMVLGACFTALLDTWDL